MKIIDVETELRRMGNILGSTLEGRTITFAADIVNEHGQWQHEKEQLCEWTTQAKGYRLATACGHTFDQEYAMTASMHGFTFCPFCGLVLKEVSK